MHRLATAFALVMLISACSSAPPVAKVEKNAASLPTKWTFITTANRNGELEPCGCSMAPLGGLQREKNVLKKWASEDGPNRLFFNAGTSFVPPSKHYNVAQMEHYRLKATYLARAMDMLGVSVHSPGIEDLGLGGSFVADLQTKTKFKWVSSNLYDKESGKPVFPQRLDYTFSDGALYVLGMSQGPGKGYPVDPRYEARDPMASLKEQMAALPAGKKIVVLLTNQDRAARNQIMKEFPQIQLVLGGTPDESTWSAHSELPTSIFGTPSDLGRSLLRVSVDFKAEPYQFISALEERMGHSRLAKLKAELQKGKRSVASQKTKLETEIRNLESALDPANSRYSRFDGKVQVLGPEFDKPEDEITSLINEYKEKVKELALKESES
jgi:hypothetical protein